MILYFITAPPLVLFAAFYLYRKFYCMRYFKRMGIPGPEPHWLYGNLNEITKVMGPDQRHDKLLRWAKTYGNIYGYYIGSTPVLAICSLEAAEQILIKQYSDFQGDRVAPIQPDPQTDIDPVTQI